ncbi:MAG: hypothetical protein MUF43_11275 [Flavobacterium sp.]|jgi:hypothetical protein|nr:hypothetical protein [Flavobacterium sp.]
MRKKLLEVFVFTFIPLFVGLMIYLLSRSQEIYINKCIDLKSYKITLPNWLKFNLIDGLWSFSLVSTLLIFCNWKIDSFSIKILIFAYIFVFLFEISFGTFDWLDLFFIFIGAATPLLKTKKNI